MEVVTEVSFGEWLKRQRSGRGLTQTQLAHHIGCAVVTLRKIESEQRRPSAQIIARLAEIFNISPNEQANFLRYARGDWKYAPGENHGEAPWLISTRSARTNLPASVTNLIGREGQLAEIHADLMRAEIRLVTLVGPPGMGKTRLGIETARQALSDFPDGVFFVALASLAEQSLVVSLIAQTLGFVGARNRTPFEQLKDGIGVGRLLIVLDNVEHLIEGTAALASDLLSACPGLKILATSREALRIPGEWLHHVSPLSLPTELASLDAKLSSQFSALTLFAERARAVRSDFVLNANNIDAVASICRQLDGLPLAIELIAARVRLMPPQALLSHLSDQFTSSADGLRGVSTRQKTLHNAIGWSYDLLSNSEQILFRRMGVFAGGWTLEAAGVICSGGGIEVQDVPDLLVRLVDKSLVTMQEQKGTARYHMLETIRQFAQERLAEAREAEGVRNRHLDFFMKLAEETEPKLLGAEQMICLERLELEQGNLRAALKWGLGNRSEAGFRLVSALWLFWFMHIHFVEGRQWYEEALSVSRDASPLIRIRLLTGAASNAMGRGDFERTAALARQCLSLSYEQEDERGIVMSLHHLGIAVKVQGNYQRAKTLFEEGLALSRETENEVLVGHLLADLGNLAMLQGDHEKAGAYHEESLSLARKRNDRWGSAYELQHLAFVAYRQGNYVRAQALAGQAMTLAREFGDRRVLSSLLELMGMVAFRLGTPVRAARLLSIAVFLLKAIGVNFTPDDRVDYDQAVAAIRAQLGEDIFEAQQAEGRTLTPEQAVSYALEQQND